MKKKEKINASKIFMPYILLFVIIIIVLYIKLDKTKVNELKYNEFYESLISGEVNKLEVTPSSSGGVYELTGTMEGYDEKESYILVAPLSDSVIDDILTKAEENDAEVIINRNPNTGEWMNILFNGFTIVLIIGAGFMLVNKLGSGNKQSMDFGRSKAKLSEDENKKTFKDVAGLKEEKEEVAELIDFLKNPKKFQKLGARIPKGILLVGPPGTGKTLLAKAIAGEAKVPFFYISGSDFVELFVGVGASRVRDMFRQAKQSAPCLIFIDEIDAVGRQRGTGLGGGHDEREQTLNQLLTEMDGFGANEGIIIIAATNRPDVLDPALLRPGRFDRQVMVTLPDVREREEILKVHARNKIIDKSVSLKEISQRTSGYSGADLENLLNEAALLAVRRNKNSISIDEIDEASDRVVMGPAKKSRVVTEKEKKTAAYHEAGHAVTGIKLNNGIEVHKITIIPRGHAGGYTMLIPEESMAYKTKEDLENEIIALLSGRISEEIFLHQQSTGAQNDFERATAIARAMVTEYGMSDLGPVQFEHQSQDVFLGRDYNKSKNFSDAVALEIDKEVKKIVDTCFEKGKKILKENKNLVEVIAQDLLKKETLLKEEIDYIIENGEAPADDIILEEKENKKEAEETE